MGIHDRLVAGLKYRIAKALPQEPDFIGVYDTFAEVPDENPWKERPWIDGNAAKLDALTPGHFSNRVSGAVADQTHILLPAMVINSLAVRGNVRVVDFGGGTGFSYFPIRDYLACPEHVHWSVLDANKELYAVGRAYAERLGTSHTISFHDGFPPFDADIVHSAGTIEYIDDADGILRELVARYQPRYFILTRIKGGSIEEFVTRQVVGGFSTPCRFSNVPKLIRLFDELGYRVLMHAPCGSYVPAQFKDIPKERQIVRSVDLILERRY
jgi:putative methyltransferase (TIGR04325 family)